MQLLDGKQLSQTIKDELATEVAEIKSKGGKEPHLSAILVGHDPASETYVANKVKACEKAGYKSSLFRLEENVSEDQLLDQIQPRPTFRTPLDPRFPPLDLIHLPPMLVWESCASL